MHLTRSVPLESHESQVPWYGRLFVTFMRALSLWGWGQGNRHALITDLALPSGNTRVVNLHLPLIAPRARIEEFELLMKHTDGAAPRIVCGDFNVIESLRMAVLNWLFGAHARDAVRYTRERFEIENRFVQYALVNPLRGRSTHPISRLQLDHILLSPHFSVADAAVVANRHGSDHHPIFVEIVPRQNKREPLMKHEAQ